MGDSLWLWVARRIPSRLRYWAIIVTGSKATCEVWTDREPGNVSLMDLLDVEAGKAKPAPSYTAPGDLLSRVVRNYISECDNPFPDPSYRIALRNRMRELVGPEPEPPQFLQARSGPN